MADFDLGDSVAERRCIRKVYRVTGVWSDRLDRLFVSVVNSKGVPSCFPAHCLVPVTSSEESRPELMSPVPGK